MDNTVGLLLEILYKIESGKKQYTLKTLSKKLKKTVPAIKHYLDIIASSQNDFVIYLDNIEWKSIETSILSSEKMDDCFLSISHKGRLLIVDKNTYKDLSDLFSPRNSSLPRKNPVVFVDDYSYKYCEDKSKIPLYEMKIINGQLAQNILPPCTVRANGITYYIMGFFDIKNDTPYVLLSKSPKGDPPYEAHPFTQKEIFYEYNSTLNPDPDLKLIIDKCHRMIERCWEPINITEDDKPVNYKLLVLDGNNIQSKVKHNLRRFPIKETKIDDKRIIIELELYQSPGVLSWILSYGGSIVVLSPNDVREQIIDEYEKILKDLILV